jgi:hypothetical protein
MRGNDDLAALLYHRVGGFTAGLRRRGLKIAPQDLGVAIRGLGATVVGRNLQRFSWRVRTYKLNLPEVPIIRQVKHQDKNADEHDHALHCIPASLGLFIQEIIFAIVLELCQLNLQICTLPEG